ncbi:carbohydrate ABC transporter permease [Phytohabitans houttuyneae]|uniref:ABC transmembrane type-1 domain-containing protein n=1 Tax=Phytohabitans houttuyneae TaxID=1076126 RepID=A0A6V8KQT0_9ACTN|nr:hypothetical protein [Phytohabitans houttuyneae]GFJ86204.1 hypothetical protein Phou_103840 [Phytohabitans houttuyneae]
MRHGKYPFIVGFLIAPVTIYVTFVIAPYLQAFYLAMTNWRGVSANAKFIGLDNFERLLQDDVFWKAVRHHGILLLVLPLAAIAIALVFAFLLNVGGGSKGGAMRGVWGSKFYRIVFFFPRSSPSSSSV